MVKKKVTFRSILISLLLGAAIISFWRGVWHLSDIYLYPSNDIISAVFSLLIGVGILYSFNFNLRGLRP
ncbi:hypothetical protein ACFLZZ_00990 [Nanoarchaeota archaeon]